MAASRNKVLKSFLFEEFIARGKRKNIKGPSNAKFPLYHVCNDTSRLNILFLLVSRISEEAWNISCRSRRLRTGGRGMGGRWRSARCSAARSPMTARRNEGSAAPSVRRRATQATHFNTLVGKVSFSVTAQRHVCLTTPLHNQYKRPAVTVYLYMSAKYTPNIYKSTIHDRKKQIRVLITVLI